MTAAWIFNSRRGPTSDDARVVGCASLRRLELFRDLPSAVLNQVAGFVRFLTIEKRGRIPVPDADGGHLLFLTEGLAKASRLDMGGRETILHLIKSGELIGAPVSDHREDVSVIALERSVAACVRARELEQIIGETKVFSEVARIRSLRLRQMEDRLDDLTLGNVPARTARILLRLCKEFPRALHCGTIVNVLLTQQDIANMIGATREVTSTTLNAFRRRGWLDVHDRYLCVHAPDELYQSI